MKFIKQIRFSYIFILLIFLFGFFIRFYQLGNIPKGLYPDESAIGYNAYSILLTGRDEYGTSFPLYFRSFDDYKMPVYIYTVVGTIKLFGANAFAVRFPSALFGSLSIIGLFFLVLELSGKRTFATIGALLLACNPWHIFFSRTGYEVNFATVLLVFGTLFFIMAIKRKNNFLLFLLSIVSFILALYTYNVTRIVSPLLFFSLIFLYRKNIITRSRKLVTTLILIFILGMLPFLITLVSLQSQAGFSSQGDALLTGKVAKVDILQTRSYFVSLPGFMQKIFFNYWVLLAWAYIKNLVSFFSTNFFFIVGPNHPHESIAEFGMFYYFEFPLIVFGVYQALKKKLTYMYPIFAWFLIMYFGVSIIVSVPNGTRTYSVVIPLVIFAAYGLFELMQLITHVKNKLIKIALISVSIIFIGYSYMFYLTSYFVRFPIELAKDWRSEDQQTVLFIRSIEQNYNKIVFDDSTGFLYTSLLFYGQYSPQLHQKQAVYELHGLVNALVKDGKYEFRNVNFDKEMQTPKTLFITDVNHTPQDKKPLATFYYPTRPVVIFYDRKIAQYPTTEVAYELFESDTPIKSQ